MGLLGGHLAPEERPVRAKIVRNVVFSSLRAALAWPIPFLLIPFILKKVGVTGYGTWALFLTIISLTSATDLGLGGTLTKYVAEHYARKDSRSLRLVIDTGLMLYSILALLTVLVLWIAAGPLLTIFFGASAVSQPGLLKLWDYMLPIVGTNILVMPFYSVVTGLQRMDLSNAAVFVNAITNAALVVLFLTLGWGVRGLLCAYLWGGVLNLCILFGITRWLLPGLAFNPLKFDWSEMRRLFSFSLKVYAAQATSIVQNQIEKVYLAAFVGVVSVGWYNIAAEAAARIRRIPELLLTPIMAAASELHARGEDSKVRELYYRAHKYLALVAVPLVVYFCASSRWFVELWLGPKLDVVRFPLVVLLITMFGILVTGPGYLILVGEGALRLIVQACVLAVSSNLLISLILIRRWGFRGAVMGTFFSVLASSSFFICLFHRHTQTPYRRLFTEAYLKPLMCSSFAIAIVTIVIRVERLGWLRLGLQALAFAAIYFACLISLRFFDSFDLVQVESILPAARVVRRIIPFSDRTGHCAPE